MHFSDRSFRRGKSFPFAADSCASPKASAANEEPNMTDDVSIDIAEPGPVDPIEARMATEVAMQPTVQMKTGDLQGSDLMELDVAWTCEPATDAMTVVIDQIKDDLALLQRGGEILARCLPCPDSREARSALGLVLLAVKNQSSLLEELSMLVGRVQAQRALRSSPAAM